jgi:hypothetical protein
MTDRAVERAAELEPARPALHRQAPGTELGAPHAQIILTLQRRVGNRTVRSLLRAGSLGSGAVLARAPRLPGFSQAGDTCGAASLVTALFLWDIERASPDNRAVVHACDLVLTDQDTASANALAKKAVSDVRALAMTRGHKLGATEYQSLSLALALLYHGRAGMTPDQISSLARGLGLRQTAFGGGNTLNDILQSDAVTKLSPGEVGQLNWIIAATEKGHAMLLGRNEDGTWFFSDQGQSPPKEIQREKHADLKEAVLAYTAIGGWLYNGNKLDLRSSMPQVVGFVAMGGIQSFLNRGPSLIVPGEKLATIDAGLLTASEVLTAWDYHSRWDSLTDAKDAITKDPGPHGGVIVERPSGMFHVYKTNPIKDSDNLKMTSIDVGASAEMVLVKRRSTFYSAWIVLADPSGTKRTPFQVVP